MILRILRTLLLPDRSTTLAEYQRKIEDGSITMLEMCQYLTLMERVKALTPSVV